MRDTLNIGPVPCNEPCEQLGPNYDPQRAKAECRAFLNQIERTIPNPTNARLRIVTEHHDFGTYYEVAVSFSDEDEAATEYAYHVESNAPTVWDEIARAELAGTMQEAQ